MNKQIRFLAATLVLAMAPALQAQTPAAPSERNAGQNLVATKIADDFHAIAGGEENALALVNALRAGSEVTLVTTVPPPAGSPAGTPPTTTETTFAVPTKPMGWGNVKHSLALARDQLARAGISNPTAEQLQTALLGGDLVVANADGTSTTTSVRGILTMRAEGMGWGNIAREGGTRLGHVQKVDMSAKSVKATPPATALGTTSIPGKGATKGITTAAGTGATVAKGGSKGITTAAGAASTSGSRGLVTAGGGNPNASPNGHAHGRGIVTAGGGSTHVAATGVGKGNAGGAGVVTAAGGSVSAAGVTHGNNAGGQGNGKGNAGGNGRGKGG